MNIRIIESINELLEVIIKCPETNETVLKLKEHIEMFDDKLRTYDGENIFLIDPLEALYFESVDNRTFLYTENNVLEIKHRLYELEETLSRKDFIRISKSQILNINKIKSLKPELNRSITATMINGEILCISRRYAQALKTLLKI